MNQVTEKAGEDNNGDSSKLSDSSATTTMSVSPPPQEEKTPTSPGETKEQDASTGETCVVEETTADDQEVVNTTDSPPQPPTESEAKQRDGNEEPERPGNSQQQGKNKKPAPLRMMSAGRRSRSGSSEHKIPMEHQKSLREFYEAGGRDYKEYLNWLSSMGSSCGNRSPQQCDDRKADTGTPATGSPSLARFGEPPKLINIMSNRFGEQQRYKNHPSVQNSTDCAPFGQPRLVKDKSILPEMVEDAVVLDLSYRGPTPQTKQKLYELLVKVGKGQPTLSGGLSGNTGTIGRLHQVNKSSAITLTSQPSTIKHSSLMAQLLTESPSFSKEDRPTGGSITARGSHAGGSSPAVSTNTGSPASSNSQEASIPSAASESPASAVETADTRSSSLADCGIRTAGNAGGPGATGHVVHHKPATIKDEHGERGSAPPAKKQRSSSTQSSCSNPDNEKEEAGKSKPQAVWPFLEEIIVRSLARSPPSRSLNKQAKHQERDRGQQARPGFRLPRQSTTEPPVSRTRPPDHPRMPGHPFGHGGHGPQAPYEAKDPRGLLMPIPPMMAMPSQACPLQQPSPEPPLLAPQQPLAFFPPGAAPTVATPPEVSPPQAAPRSEECTSASDRDLLSWDVEQVVNFVGSLPKCRDFVEVFREQEIDGLALSQLNEDHLVRFLQMRLGPAIRLRLAVTAKLRDVQR